MSIAKLGYISDSGFVTLESGSLFYIDYCTNKYTSEQELFDYYKTNFRYNLGKNPKLILEYVSDSYTKEVLPILYDKNPIYIRNNYYKDEISEVEKARKLLFNSKNRLFLRKFLLNKSLASSANFKIKISNTEYHELKKHNIEVFEHNEQYYINCLVLLRNILYLKKYGLLRTLFEDSLEKWKKNLLKLNDDTLYYYCRGLRGLYNDYYKNINCKFGIKNLKIIKTNLHLFLVKTYSIYKIKKKILKKTS